MFISVYDIEVNNFTCIVLCGVSLSWLIEHLYIDMIIFQDKQIKQVNVIFDVYGWNIADTA